MTDFSRDDGMMQRVIDEIQQTPPEYLPNLLQIIRLFRESVELSPAEESFRQEWQEAMRDKVLPIEQLWDGIDE
ncbi:MAG: hypothetical protein F6K04_27025, partial [Leptolyngbya sp. SIO4C5]|nr:hypothetical protein [Leptolyngbya sp. SIO4C5]